MGLVPLCYHKVGSEADEGRRLNVHPNQLDSHVRFFKRRDYQFKRASECANWFDEKTVCFTFDDGFLSTIESGSPVFDRWQVPMTVYIVSNFVGKSSEWEGALSRPLATWDDLRKMQARGHEIGNHTESHPFLAKLNGSEQLQEVKGCSDAMLANGLRTESFCYPYGNLNESAVQAVEQAGFRVGMALGKRLPNRAENSLKIPRIVVAYSDSLPLLIYRLFMLPKLRRLRSE